MKIDPIKDEAYYLRSYRDKLQHEIGELKEENRWLKIALEETRKQRDNSIGLIVALRSTAREQKNYDLSDFLREALKEMGIDVKDLRT